MNYIDIAKRAHKVYQALQDAVGQQQADIHDDIGGVDRMADESIHQGRADAPVDGQDPETPSQRQDGEQAQCPTGQQKD